MNIIRKFIKQLKIKNNNMDFSTTNIQKLKENGAIIGENVHMYSSLFALEPQLVTVGDNCTIGSDVLCVTHDNAIIHHLEGKTDLFGKVSIGNNCFIGPRSMIMYGVTIGDNCIVGAGSVVTKNIPNNKVVAGNPARIICSVEQYVEKYKDKAVDWSSITSKRTYFEEHPEYLIDRH